MAADQRVKFSIVNANQTISNVIWLFASLRNRLFWRRDFLLLGLLGWLLIITRKVVLILWVEVVRIRILKFWELFLLLYVLLDLFLLDLFRLTFALFILIRKMIL